MKRTFLLFILAFAVFVNALAQKETVIKGGIVNGKAKYLPKPEYPQEAKDFCASGKVEVEVLIDEKGDVISAEAISGDELLRKSAIKAAEKAKFKHIDDLPPKKIKGILVYNFVPERKCIVINRVVNKRAKYLTEPIYPKSCRCEGIIKVRIVVDTSGDVISARADSGNPLLRISGIEAARKTKFYPSFINGPPIFVVAFLEYKFYSNGKVSA
ncbi:MAG TPA: TonB family protein [Pyrinomonadaceae bacterium]|jgi:TonB family protein